MPVADQNGIAAIMSVHRDLFWVTAVEMDRQHRLAMAQPSRLQLASLASSL